MGLVNHYLEKYNFNSRTRSSLLFASIAGFCFVAISLALNRDLIHIGTAPNISDSTSLIHPIRALVDDARASFEHVSSRQSTSFEAAVTEYRRRYRLEPPPHFDKWYAYTQEHNVTLVDEYDAIHDFIKPFWGISPATLRRNVRSAIGTHDYMIALRLRGGRPKVIGGPAWKSKTIKDAIEPFAEYLPDMDLAFNDHDEPRVMIPYDLLSQMLERAHQAQRSHSNTLSQWSTTPVDLQEGFVDKTAEHPFVDYSRQYTWSLATLSCPSTSPARLAALEDVHMEDDHDTYAYLPLGFVRNHTAFTDVCQNPTLKDRHGFFNMPNALSVTHDPIPIFSPSKVSSYHDLLYPAPWYLARKAGYDESKDRLWPQKGDQLYWRGGTTTGYADHGSWHRQGRQRFVESVEQPGDGLVLEKKRLSGEWKASKVPREQYKDLFDVHFTYVGQCAKEDCAAQESYFNMQPKSDFNTNWLHKYLLDMDGNAFSGRFYAFLKSYSLTLKQAVFREWHDDRIKPWVHYLPLGMNGTDHIEMMRFLTQDEDGRQIAQEVAVASRQWAFRTLRQEDLRAWIFRLLLEYGRLVDDKRASLGYRSR